MIKKHYYEPDEKLSSGYGRVRQSLFDVDAYVDTVPDAIEYLIALYGNKLEIPKTLSELERTLLKGGFEPMTKESFMKISKVIFRYKPVVYDRAILYDYGKKEYALDKDGNEIYSKKPNELLSWLQKQIELRNSGVQNNELNRLGIYASKLGIKDEFVEVPLGEHTGFIGVYEDNFGNQLK